MTQRLLLCFKFFHSLHLKKICSYFGRKDLAPVTLLTSSRQDLLPTYSPLSRPQRCQAAITSGLCTGHFLLLELFSQIQIPLFLLPFPPATWRAVIYPLGLSLNIASSVEPFLGPLQNLQAKLGFPTPLS